MAEKTAIEWAHATWNPWIGCHKVSPGCKNCYMFRDLGRRKQNPNQPRRAKTVFDAPVKWIERYKKGVRDEKTVYPGSRIFTCSLSDWFIEEVDSYRQEAWDIIKRTPEYTYLILTKRHERIADHLPKDWGNGYHNVWLLVTAEDEAYMKLRWTYLSKIKARVKGLSIEPLLGRIESGAMIGLFNETGYPDWIITGGESDRVNPRIAKEEWFYEIISYCRIVGIPVFHKQNGGTKKINGHWGGNEVFGKTYTEILK